MLTGQLVFNYRNIPHLVEHLMAHHLYSLKMAFCINFAFVFDFLIYKNKFRIKTKIGRCIVIKFD